MVETRENKCGQLLVRLADKKVPAGSLTLDDANLFMGNYLYSIIDDIEAWPDKLHPALAQKIARRTKSTSGIGDCLFENIKRFKGVNKKEQKKIAIQLMRSGALSKFGPFDWFDQEVALVMIEVGLGFKVAESPFAFKNFDPKKIVWAMAKKCPHDIEKFMKNCK